VTHKRPHTRPGTERDGGGRARAPGTTHARVLSLQRAIGNSATQKLMRKTATDQFRLVIVPDGELGVSQDVLNRALGVVKKGLATVTGGSRNPTVKRGFAVDYRSSEGDLEGLHRRVFLCYLIQGRDADRAVALATPHMPRGYGPDLKDQARELNSIGGTNLRVDFDSGKSPSVSFASTGALAELAKGREGGDKLAGLLLGEIILHELGHALKAKHSDGIMEGKAVFDSATLGKPRRFAPDSISEMRERLEYLAGR
jgi:hypothetical protein